MNLNFEFILINKFFILDCSIVCKPHSKPYKLQFYFLNNLFMKISKYSLNHLMLVNLISKQNSKSLHSFILNVGSMNKISFQTYCNLLIIFLINFSFANFAIQQIISLKKISALLNLEEIL